jgi:hypothetical protein
MTFLYARPCITCHGFMKNPSHWCDHLSQLPYPDIPHVTEEEWSEALDIDPLELPTDEWTIFFGCRQCGYVDTYYGHSLAISSLERQQLAQFHNETNCFSVELQCARIDCKSPAKLHMTLFSGKSEKDLIRLLRLPDFCWGDLPCGHQIMPIPEPFYRNAHRVMNRLW